MSGYIPVKTKMDSEDHYNSPYDTHDLEGETHYEAPSCLKRNPSGSLFIPSGDTTSPGEGNSGSIPLEGRLRYAAYSPHHTLRQGSYSPQHNNGSQNSRQENLYTNASRSTVYNVGTLGTRLGSTLMSRGGVGGVSPRSPNGDFKHFDTTRSTLPNSYGSSGHLTGVYHPATHPLHVSGGKRPNSSSENSHSNSFRLKSDLNSRCSWKFVSIFFMLFSFLLVSALIYTAASNIVMQSARTGFDSAATACAVVEDGSNNNSLQPLNTNSAGKSDDEEEDDDDEVRVPHVVGLDGGASLPPDRTTFQPLPLATKVAQVIPPYSFWNFQFQQPESAYISLNFLVPKGASIGLYARKNAIPSLTNHDIRDVLRGFRGSSLQLSSSHLEKRDVASVEREASYYLEAGHWFLSLYNDDSDPRQLEMTVSVSPDLTSACPRGCSGHGECLQGQCHCTSGYIGTDCATSTCPVLCSNNGEYAEGACRCFPGWKGAECSIRHNECEVPDCNNHGTCYNGECACAQGYTGQFCQEVDCPDPSCSGQGVCVAGSCICRKGWEGPACSEASPLSAATCPPPTCSGRGSYDPRQGRCTCAAGFTGVDCSKEVCNLDCGPHGVCESGGCVCEPGWRGPRCDVQHCDPRCSEHGMCSNGTCLCTNGWNGKHCTLEGCPGNCNGHGTCTSTYQLAWECLCESGWYGSGCQIQLELNCDDKIDNDKDGLVDCEDPECCESPACERSQLCHTVAAPIDILLRKQPPALTASFYERMRFIIEDKGLQSYAKKEGFNESRAAVVRGKVVTPNGMGLIGVRVSTNGANEGFTMTRDDGWFDLMVNGGGAVMLQFGRNPYSPLRLALHVPWNEVVVLAPPVRLHSKEELHVQVPRLYENIPPCPAHDYARMQPIALTSWHTTERSGSQVEPAILAETQVVREVIRIPGSGMRLVYHSGRAKGFYSTIQLQLTPASVPESLVRVHLHISIEGILEEKLFEADPNIKYTFAWDRMNIYRQRVYGITTANIKVGYEYRDCEQLVWEAQTARLAGHDMGPGLSDIGGWSLDVQHKYNFHEGILQKGSGANIYLKYKPLVVTTLMGTGNPRPLDCPPAECDGPVASGLPLLAPKAVAAGPDGALFVADHNLIRRIGPDGAVTTLLQLNSTRMSYRYHLAHRTFAGELEQRQTLYISLPESYKIIRLKSIDSPAPHDRNWVDAIGTGERCLPGDPDDCGDGGKASEARLSYPKGIAVGPDGQIYIADGNTIRAVDQLGQIRTLVGHQQHQHRATWRPLPCAGGALPASEVQLNWPTDLAVSPLDGALHFIDDSMVLRLTKDGRVQVVLGRPLHCHPTHYAAESIQSTPLNEPQSIAFGPQGELYVAESDGQRINRVRRVNGRRLEVVAGKNSNCNCRETASCKCWDPKLHLAAATRFSSISSVAVTPDGSLYVADQGNFRIRAVTSVMPSNEKEDEEVFEVPDPASQELYVFNRYGQHILTKDLMTRATLYSMEYHQSTSTGKLVSITDEAGQKLTIIRDYSGQVTALQTADGQKHVVKVNRMGHLESWEQPDGYRIEFHYLAPTGLLVSRLDSQHYGQIYQYDQYGRLTGAVAPTGEATALTFNLTALGGTIQVGGETVLTVNSNRVARQLAASTMAAATGLPAAIVRETLIQPDSSLQVTEGERRLHLTTITHPSIGQGGSQNSNPLLGDSYPMLGELRVELAGSLLTKVGWEYSLQASGSQLLGISRRLRVNGEILLSVAYDRLQRRELLLLADKTTEVLEIKYDEQSRPVTWVSPLGIYAPVSQRYNRFGQLEHWRWGDLSESYTYDKKGRLASIQQGNVTLLTYEYRDNSDQQPLRVRTPGGGNGFLFDVDSRTGAVRSVATPRGHLHSWSVSQQVGSVRWSYIAPWSTSAQPYAMAFNARGDLLLAVLPNGEQVSYNFSPAGQLIAVFAGQTEIEFGREAATGCLDAIAVSHAGVELREKRKYHNGLLKEVKLRYSGLSSLDNIIVRYQVDGTGRPAKVMTAIGGRKEGPSLSWSYDQNSGLLMSVDGLKIRRPGPNRTEVLDSSGGVLKMIEMDAYGHVRRLVYSARRQQLLSLLYDYDLSAGEYGRVQKVNIVDKDQRATTTRYSYTAAGQLERTVLGSDTIGQTFKYDEAGNIVAVNSGQGQQRTVMAYGPGDRVDNHAGRQVSYDANGFVAAIEAEKFLYNGLGQLAEYISSSGLRTRYYQDQLGRLTALADAQQGRALAQLFYLNPLAPHQLSLIHYPQGDTTQRLSYDSLGHLVQIEMMEGQQQVVVYAVACDALGSPLVVFQPTSGAVVKRIEYSPFGEILLDSQPGLRIPIGWSGALTLGHSSGANFLLFPGGRPYEPSLAQWLTPDWRALLLDREQLTAPHRQLFLYRYKHNNPLQTRGSESASNPRMVTLEDWADRLGYNMGQIFQSVDSPTGCSCRDQLPAVRLSENGPISLPGRPVLSELDSLVEAAVGGLKQLSFVRRRGSGGTTLSAQHRLNLLPRFASTVSPFGQGFLLSVMTDGRAVAYPVEVQNSVVQKIFESVLNNSIYLDLSHSDPRGSNSVYYFVKPTLNQFALDSDTVRRLAGEFTVSPRDAASGGKELSLVSGSSGFEVRILYGSPASVVRSELLRSLTAVATAQAWSREKYRVSRGFGGSSADWTPAEMAELIRTGEVKGYEPVEIQPAERYPALARDGTNFEFGKVVSSNSAVGRGRKNRHARRKHMSD